MPPVLSIVMPFSGERDLNLALKLLTIIDLEQLRTLRLPPLYQSGLRWKRDTCIAPRVPGACERFRSAATCIAEQDGGDCDDFAPWRAAELILAGDRRARAFAIRSSVGWHCLVRRGDGSIEDPSIRLGMKGGV